MKNNHLFSRVPHANIQRSSFKRDHRHMTTMDAGKIYPFFVDEVLPGDTFNLKCNIFSRITTLVVPIMDNIYFDVFYFFVPNRLVWDHWKNFMGEQKSPNDSIDYLIPTIDLHGSSRDVDSLADHFGIPIQADMGDREISALPFRAYNLIYQEWFKDENLIDAPELRTDDGPDDGNWYTVRRRGKRHDYFTSCLPWPQKGPGVEIALGGSAPISYSGSGSPVIADGDLTFRADFKNPNYWIENMKFRPGVLQGNTGDRWDGSYYYSTVSSEEAGHPSPVPENEIEPLQLQSGVNLDLRNMYADLTHAGAVTINSLRTAFQLQRFYERMALGGSRYTEVIRSFFGVVSPDARLQRPEYLGGSTQLMQINSVQQTSGTSGSGTPQGNLSAVGVLGSRDNGFTKSFTEHGYIIGLCSIRTDLTYQQGLNRMWSRKTREDFYWPTFAHLGEQAVLNKEIYAQGNDQDNEVFGYQERYAEYRYYPSMITGKLRSTSSQSLDVWHLAQHFTSLPTLNQQFIEENVPMDRVLAVTDEPAFKVDFYINLNCVRPMPVYSVPGLVDHF